MKFTIGSLLLAALVLLTFQASSCKNAGSETNAETLAEPDKIQHGAIFLEQDAFSEGMRKNKSVILDVRMPQNFEQGHIEGAMNVNFFDPTFKSQLLSLDKGKEYYLYCKNGTMSQRAAEYMMYNDFPAVYVLKGGYDNYLTAQN